MLKKVIDFNLQGLGFSSTGDLVQSTFRTNSKFIMKTTLILGTLATFVDQYLGISPLAYLFFMILIFGEVITGILASNVKGIKIQSRKVMRMGIKMAVYTLLIGGLHQFSEGIEAPVMFGMSMNIYVWIYYCVLNMIILQLLVSVLENLSELGYEETSTIFKVIKQKLSKWFELKNEDK